MMTASMDWEEWKHNLVFQVLYMTVMWLICCLRNNGSMVDLGWPNGFSFMTVYFFFTSTGYLTRRVTLCSLVLFAGLRFVYGWLFARKHWKKEDHRWDLWRERWRKGEGWFAIRSIPVNFFFFYHTQTLANALIFSFPLYLACHNAQPSLHFLEVFAVVLWLVAFATENVADFQLTRFKVREHKKQKEREQSGSSQSPPSGAVCRDGLWKYSRHPNYFCELLLWTSYSIFALPSVTSTWHYLPLALQPVVAYYFLVHFTGAWMAEQSSLRKRGAEYEKYIRNTPILFPWFPKY
eukprot:TRINITY_DN2873_c0_g2_i1.p1 TRINITY_DN2873_c0_g2~~TRINITY_DN2873_c0_g2_i1.p1  ORF type:complete len:293 (-),score=46.87 TRINITY_DN2873_c0_g2_i1:59-937(-)